MYPMVSVIVPVYNVEQYLERCLETLVNQNFDNIEIIVVNDGSTDNSELIIKEYSKKYNFLKIINKVNGGLSSARNSGLKEAKGKYVLFIDSDDFINLDMIGKMLESATQYQSDIVICNFEFFYNENNKRKFSDYVYQENKIYSNEEILRMLFENKISAHAWNKLIKRSFMEEVSIEFPEGRYYEDMPVMFKLLANSNKVTLLNESLYYYVQREGAITKNTNIKKFEDHLRIFDDLTEIFKDNEHNSLYKKEYYVFKINQLYFSLKLLSMLNSNESKLAKEILKQKVKGLKWFPVLGNFIGTRERIKFLILKLKS